ncbi:hypothetical protein HZA40_02290 [Candidatus Peregrinibacteria bacterium]|nr:hypothetical protein [Candidatus Peregrinibacteria bacterium]
MIKKFASLFAGALGISVLLPKAALAHCPLCTIGAGAVAIGAAWLGVSAFSIGIFLGAFAIALGLWIGRLIKKKYIPHQSLIIGVISFLTTILPLEPLMYDNSAVLVSLSGDYGTWLNTTYLIDKFLVGAIIGALIVLISPRISKLISKAGKNKFIPFQGIIITFLLLLFVSLVYEILK